METGCIKWVRHVDAHLALDTSTWHRFPEPKPIFWGVYRVEPPPRKCGRYKDCGRAQGSTFAMVRMAECQPWGRNSGRREYRPKLVKNGFSFCPPVLVPHSKMWPLQRLRLDVAFRMVQVGGEEDGSSWRYDGRQCFPHFFVFLTAGARDLS